MRPAVELVSPHLVICPSYVGFKYPVQHPRQMCVQDFSGAITAVEMFPSLAQKKNEPFAQLVYALLSQHHIRTVPPT